MKSIYLAVLAVALSLSPGLTPSAKGGKSSCTTEGANFEIADNFAGNPTALSSNGGSTYTNGDPGVIGRINCNGQSLELSVSGVRQPSLNLGGRLLNGTLPIGSSAPVAFFNIPLGIHFNNAQPDPAPWTLTTYLKVTMASPNLGYFFNMENPNADLPLNDPDQGVNTPLITTLVNVQHIPAGSNPVTPETWVVTPAASPAVGTLRSNVKGGLRTVGQFDAPFSIKVTRQ